MFHALVGLVLGLVARLWLLTLRLRVYSHPLNDPTSPDPWVLALWHGHLLPLLAHRRRRRTVALVSWSKDGQVLAWAMRWLGVHSERGSSSRGGKIGLNNVVSHLHNGWDAAFAVDGPKGPRRLARPGALLAAQRSGAHLVPYAVACSHSTQINSWDRFLVPWPFSRVVVVLGEPISDVMECTTEDLAIRIDDAARLAQERLLPVSATSSLEVDRSLS